MDFSKRREEIKLQCLHTRHSNNEWDRYKHWLPPEGCKGERTRPAWVRGRFPAFLVDSGPWTGLWRCDVVLYNKDVFGLWPLFQHRAPKILGIGLEESDQVSLVMLMRWLFESTQVTWGWRPVARGPNHVTWRLELSVPPLANFQEGERGWKVNQLPVANDLINSAYVMKCP